MSSTADRREFDDEPVGNLQPTDGLGPSATSTDVTDGNGGLVPHDGIPGAHTEPGTVQPHDGIPGAHTEPGTITPHDGIPGAHTEPA